jgi:hypothetical protein
MKNVRSLLAETGGCFHEVTFESSESWTMGVEASENALQFIFGIGMPNRPLDELLERCKNASYCWTNYSWDFHAKIIEIALNERLRFLDLCTRELEYKVSAVIEDEVRKEITQQKDTVGRRLDKWRIPTYPFTARVMKTQARNALACIKGLRDKHGSQDLIELLSKPELREQLEQAALLAHPELVAQLSLLDIWPLPAKRLETPDRLALSTPLRVFSAVSQGTQ